MLGSLGCSRPDVPHCKRFLQRWSCCWETRCPERDPGALSPNHLVCKSRLGVGCGVCKALSWSSASGAGGAEVPFGVAAPMQRAVTGQLQLRGPRVEMGKGEDYPSPRSNGPTLCKLSTRVAVSGSRRKGARSPRGEPGGAAAAAAGAGEAPVFRSVLLDALQALTLQANSLNSPKSDRESRLC